jgi:hypothetical protein
MIFNHDHDRYVAKNRAMSSGTDLLGRRGTEAPKAAAVARPPRESCFNCKDKKSCQEFRSRRGGRGTGVVSVGGSIDDLKCAKYQFAAEERRGMSTKQIKSLMRNFNRTY